MHCGLWMSRRSFNVEQVQAPEEDLCVVVCEFFEGFSCFSAVPDSLVFDVCDVHYVFYMVSPVFEPAPDEVSAGECTDVADVGVAVDGGATDIHGHLWWVYWF